MFKKILFSLVLLFTMQSLFSQVKINEYSVSNSILSGGSTFTDNQGDTPDWIELYNAGASNVSIGGWHLTDDPSVPYKYAFPVGTSVPAGGFLRIWCSGKGDTANATGHIHTNFKLTQCKGEWIVLSSGATIRDSLQLKITQATHSRGRSPNGASTWKIYTSPTPNASNSGTTYNSYAPTPVFSLPAGFYSGTQNINLTVVPSASITVYYTVDGSEPTTGSSLYFGSPITVSSTSVVRAYAVSSNAGVLPSLIETNTYFFGESGINNTYGVVSISGGTPLYNAPNGGLMGGNSGSTPKTHFEYFDNKVFVAEAYGLSDKHGNDSWAYDQRGIDFETKDDYGFSNAVNFKIFNDAKLGDSKRKEFQHLILKAAASDNYPFQAQSSSPANDHPSAHMRDAFVQSYGFVKGLALDGRRYKPVILFVNGAYHGVYELREAFDEDYTDYYHNQPDIMELKYWGGYVNSPKPAWVTDWDDLYNYVMSNSMTNVADYAYVDSALSFKSLIDYMIYNSYVVNSDFINWNSAWWRGTDKTKDKHKWRYYMWDMDNVYALGENYSGLPTTDMEANPCDYESTFQGAGSQEGHPDIMKKLMTNPAFKNMYINRYADLLNSALKCEKIMEHFNYFKTFLTPEMPRQINKWSAAAGGGSMTEWNQNMDTLEKRIQQRCSFIESKIASCYNVSGPYDITVDVEPVGAGTVKLNSLYLDNFQWSGRYFGGVQLSFEQQPTDTAVYKFDHWEFKNHVVSPDIYADSVSITLATTENVIAHYVEKNVDVMFPTAFTPNGDGRNDILFPLGTRFAKNISVEIWNRWGQLVYSSTDLNKGWDGYYQGAEAQTGVYAYLLKYTMYNGEEKMQKGNITLIR
jgi:gliding motility-associated-like protein